MERGCEYTRAENEMVCLPATQFPTPALNDWLRRRALMGHFLFVTAVWKSSNIGMERMGSNPSSEMGGSFRGLAHSLIRAKRRASVNATLVGSVSDSPLDRFRMNWSVMSEMACFQVRVHHTLVNRGGHVSNGLLRFLSPYMRGCSPFTY